MKKLSKLLAFLLVLVAVLSVAACGKDKKKTTAPQTTAPTTTVPTTAPTAPPPTEPPAPSYLTVIGEGKTAYRLVFAKVSEFTGLSSIASAVRSMAASSLGAGGMPISNDSAAEAELEILIGDTNRAESVAIASRLAETANDAHFQYVIAEMNGKLILYADHNIAYSSYLLDYFLSKYVNTETKELKIAEGTFDLQTVTFAAHEAYLKELEEQAKAEEEAKRQEIIAALVAKNNSFRISDFGRITPIESSYDTPEVYPTKGSHPRIYVTPESLPSVRANLSAPENAEMYKKLIEFSEKETEGHLRTVDKDSHNMDYDTLLYIESKAFRYLIEGDEKYGYEAILAIKNYILELYISISPVRSIHDYCRAYGYTMYIAACVYDWCYDLLTPGDRAQIIAGVQTKLAPYFEMGFPPKGQGSVTGHGTEAQLLRDWLTFAMATYDEYPDMYEFVAGRIHEEYRDAGEFYMQSGAHWQGSSYGPYRYYFMLAAHLLFDRMSNGEYSFHSELLRGPAYFFMQTLRPDDRSFPMGDGYGGISSRAIPAYFASVIFGDPVLKGFARSQLGGKAFSGYSHRDNALTPAIFLCINDPSIVPVENYREELPIVAYFGYPRGHIVARTAWNDATAAAVYMKIGEAYSANHEHRDAGHFMIYYKGSLVTDSGSYTSYGTKHDYSYHKQTVAHNCMLVYNPALDNSNDPNTFTLYSGGQSIADLRENYNLREWMGKSAIRQATVLGSAWKVLENGAGSSDDEYLWSYLAGDLTKAYDAVTVDEASRYMISIMTENEENPMVFLVFDRVTATDPTFKKTFLLHTQAPPTVDYAGDSASFLGGSGSGRLQVQSLLGDVTYTVIGGRAGETVNGAVNETDMQFYVGGKNFYLEDDPNYLTSQAPGEIGWGRIEISPVAEERTSLMLTVMYVTDAENEAALIPAAEICGSGVVGAEILGKTVLFPEGEKLLSHPASFTTSATEGTTEYYLTGLNPGLWRISVNGGEARSILVDGSGIITFTDAVGSVTITPAFSTISYELNGGAASTPLPVSYNFGDSFILPRDLTLYGSEFVGWFTEDGREVTGITAADTEPLMLYARWNKVFDVLTFEMNGGVIDGEKPSRELLYGKEYRLPTSASKQNAIFLGWYLSPTFAGLPVTVLPADRERGDLTVYARFQTVYYSNDFESDSLPTVAGTDSTARIEDGVLVWSNPKGDSGFTLIPEEGYADPTQTISFDLIVPEDGRVMDFLIRLRPSERNQIDLPIVTMKDGRMTFSGSETPFLDTAVDHGTFRITLVLSNDNAGLETGLSAPVGGVTTASGFTSTVTMLAYVNGVYITESRLSTYLTFGQGYNFSKDGYTVFSSEMTTFQFYSRFPDKVELDPEGTPTEVRLDNIMISDGARTVGGRYFLHLGKNEIDPEDTDYISDGEIVSLPRLRLDAGAELIGWYLTPDFSGSPITALDGVNAGAALYPYVFSHTKRIFYETAGGVITDPDCPTSFLDSEGLAALPSEVRRAHSTFLGWYLDPNFQTKVDAIPAGTQTDVTLYARYSSRLMSFSFDSEFGKNDGLIGRVTKPDNAVHGNAESFTTWIAPSEENGQNGYIAMAYDGTNGADKAVTHNAQFIDLTGFGSPMGDRLTVSFRVKASEAGPAWTQARVRPSGSTGEIWFLRIHPSGAIMLASDGPTIGQISSTEWTTVTVEITEVGVGQINLRGYVNGGEATSLTVTADTEVDELSEMARIQIRASHATPGTDGSIPTIYIDDVTLTDGVDE